MNFAPPSEFRGGSKLHSRKTRFEVHVYQFGPISVEVGDLKRDHLILLPYRNVDVL